MYKVVSVNIILFYGILFFSEVYLLKNNRQTINSIAVSRANKQGVAFDTRSRFDVLVDRRKRGLDTWPSYAPYLLLDHELARDFLPLSGISNVDTILCNEIGNYVFYQSDKYGFNNKNSVYENAIDIVLIGDSFTHGHCNQNENNIAGVISHKLSKNILNLGLSGNGPLLQYAILKEYGLDTKAENIVWIYFEGNDMIELGNELNNKILRNYLENDYRQGLKNAQSKSDQMIKSYIKKEIDEYLKKYSFVENFKSVLRLKRLRGILKESFKQKPKEKVVTKVPELEKTIVRLPESFQFNDFRKLEEILEKANQEIKEQNKRLLFVYLPWWYRYGKRLVENHGEDYPWLRGQYASLNRRLELALAAENELRAITARLKIPYIDIPGRFSKHPDPASLFPYGLDGHYTDAGVEIVVDEIIKEL